MTQKLEITNRRISGLLRDTVPRGQLSFIAVDLCWAYFLYRTFRFSYVLNGNGLVARDNGDDPTFIVFAYWVVAFSLPASIVSLIR